MLEVTEIYRSVQGESTYMGLPCVFIRLTGLQPSMCLVRYNPRFSQWEKFIYRPNHRPSEIL